ncbi:MAG: hypothetical protein ACRCWC_15470 [Plesiomonas shigelloides]
MSSKRDAIEVGLFDVALIFTGIFTLPATASMAADIAKGWQASLLQAIMLFSIRTVARYAWRRYFRKSEAK